MVFTVGYSGDSYVDIEYIDAYFAARNTATWTGELVAKQAAAIRATDYVRALFEQRFDPAKVDPQLLPDNLLKAVSEYALIELVTPGGLAPVAPIGAAQTVVTKEKIGPIETSYTVVGGATANPGTRRKFPVADALIAWLLLPSLGLNRTYR